MTRLPMKEALRELTSERKKVPVMERVSVRFDSMKNPDPLAMVDNAYGVTFSAEFRMNMTVRDLGDALNQAYGQAERTLVHEVYGPLYNDIFEALCLLHEEVYESKAAIKLEEILEALR